MSDHYIYVICKFDGDEAEAPVKVGITRNVEGRLRSIQTSCPFKLGLFWVFRVPAFHLERQFHSVQAAERRQGEWFDMDPAMATFWMCLNFLTFMRCHLKLTKEQTVGAFSLIGIDDPHLLKFCREISHGVWDHMLETGEVLTGARALGQVCG